MADRQQRLTVVGLGFDPERYRRFIDGAPEVEEWPTGERSFYLELSGIEDEWHRAVSSFLTECKNWEVIFDKLGNEPGQPAELVPLQSIMRRYTKALAMPEGLDSHPSDLNRKLTLLRSFQAKLKEAIT